MREIEPPKLSAEDAAFDFIGKTLLGDGAYGFVWLAEEKATRKPCVLKVVDEEFAPLLIAERDRLASLHHPHIVKQLGLCPIYDFDATLSHLALALEHLEGGSLADYIEAGQLPTPEEVRVALHGMAGALENMHAEDICHGDLRPENVVLRRKNRFTEMVIVDLAPFVPENMRTGHNMRHWSPERSTLGSNLPTPEDDVYALALTFAHVLQGALPVPEDYATRVKLYLELEDDDVTYKGTLCKDREVDGLLTRMLSKAPHARPSASDIRCLLEGMKPTHPGTPGTRSFVPWILGTLLVLSWASWGVLSLGKAAPDMIRDVETSPISKKPAEAHVGVDATSYTLGRASALLQVAAEGAEAATQAAKRPKRRATRRPSPKPPKTKRKCVLHTSGEKECYDIPVTDGR